MEDGEAFRDEGYAGAWCGAAACTTGKWFAELELQLEFAQAASRYRLVPKLTTLPKT